MRVLRGQFSGVLVLVLLFGATASVAETAKGCAEGCWEVSMAQDETGYLDADEIVPWWQLCTDICIEEGGGTF